MTSRPKTHLCIATGQNLPNLIAALQLAASRVLIVETPAMQESARYLRAALVEHGIDVEHHSFDDADPKGIVASAESLALKLGQTPMIFNVTGGHKLMTLALSEQLRMADDLHVIYCETPRGRIDWLSPNAETASLGNLLSIDDVLRVQGFRIQKRGEADAYWAAEADQRKLLTKELGDHADKLARFFGTLNRLADQCLGNEPNGPWLFQQELEFVPGGRPAEILNRAVEAQLLSWDGDTSVVFRSEAAARYFRGGWLEEYAWLKLRGIKPKDWSLNLQAVGIKSQSPNEFDALVVHHNKLLMIECKTSRFGRDSMKDASYIYKLAQLAQQVGGSMAGSLLLSARQVSEEVRKRATESRVEILAAEDVRKLPDFLRTWMNA